MIKARVDRFLSSPQRVDVGMIGGQPGRHFGTLGNGAVAGTRTSTCRAASPSRSSAIIGTDLIGAARVEERDQDVGEHVAGEQDATVRERTAAWPMACA